jgi:hypothetical protein
MAKFGTFEELLTNAAPEPAAIARALRARVYALHPAAVEVVRLGDNAASYGVGPKKMSEACCYIMPHKRWVNLGFYNGAALPDPDHRLEGTGKRLRHVKVRSVAEADQPAIAALLAAAWAERRAALGLADA